MVKRGAPPPNAPGVYASNGEEYGNAVLAPGKMELDSNRVDINFQEAILRDTEIQQDITLVWKLSQCRGCSLAKRAPGCVSSATIKDFFEPVDRVFIHLSDVKPVSSAGEAKHPFLTWDEFPRKIWIVLAGMSQIPLMSSKSTLLTLESLV